jgi:transposase
VISHVVEPMSILVNRRAKTDRLDAQGLLRILAAHAKGDHEVCSVVRVPTIEEEDAKRQHREREHLVQERVRIENRIAALLTTQGIRKRPSLRSWEKDMEEMPTGDGRPMPPLLRAEVDRLRRRLTMTLEMIREVEAEREQALVTQDDMASRTIQALRRIRGIGENFAAVLSREVFYREFENRRQIASYLGLTPTRFPERWNGSRSTDQPGRQCQGAQDAHPACLALAALSARQQLGMLVPGTCRKFARAHPPHRIVAMARKLLIAIWRYATTGIVPEGAQLSI